MSLWQWVWFPSLCAVSVVLTIYSSDFVWMNKTSQIARFIGPTWGPPGSCRPQMGPMLAPWTLLSGITYCISQFRIHSWYSGIYIAITHGCVRNDSETHETMLLDWECNPVTPVECVSLSFSTNQCVPAFITHIMYKRNWNDWCLVNLIYSASHIFQICDLLHCVDESWWNVPFKETRLGEGVADDAVAMLLPLWLHAWALWRHTVWIRIVTSHNAWMGYEYSTQNLNRPRAIHKHDPHPLDTIGRVW